MLCKAGVCGGTRFSKGSKMPYLEKGKTADAGWCPVLWLQNL